MYTLVKLSHDLFVYIFCMCTLTFLCRHHPSTHGYEINVDQGHHLLVRVPSSLTLVLSGLLDSIGVLWGGGGSKLKDKYIWLFPCLLINRFYQGDQIRLLESNAWKL